MSEIRYIEESLPHKTSEVVCLGCLKRWIAVRPMATLLKDLECIGSHKQGYVIETGELFDFDEE